MTEARLPQELEEQAALDALGILESGDRRASADQLQGKSRSLRLAAAAYRAVVEALASAVPPVRPRSSLRQRIVNRVADEAARETAEFECVANDLALNAVPVAPRASVRERLLARVAGTVEPVPQKKFPFTFLRTAELEWREVNPGVFIKSLHNDKVNARATMLLRMEPGSVYGAHRHAQMEEIYILEGSCNCAGRVVYAGDYYRAEAGSIHLPTTTETGSLMLVISSTRNEPLPY